MDEAANDDDCVTFTIFTMRHSQWEAQQVGMNIGVICLLPD